ncbi:hypothetical protein, partial [Arthrobacter rhombi]|uniref:hypothetical protein n=1 Tax=Arthrobacter rhombi TaxID=71253 RepID=UPI0035647CB6
MFESVAVPEPGPAALTSTSAAQAPGTPGDGSGVLDLLSGVLAWMPAAEVAGLDETVLVDVISRAESLKNALAGLQARAEVVLDETVRVRQEAGGMAAG